MKKTNNKGFSLVELIIVIAIMAILAGAIAPALIRYIDKSRKSNDLSAAKTIKTAVETAMANEVSYEYLTSGTGAATAKSDLDGKTIDYYGSIILTPGTATAGNGSGVAATCHSSYTPGATDQAALQTEVGKNVGETIPKIKYKKAANDNDTPSQWEVYCTKGGAVVVGLGDGSIFYQLVPETSTYYQ